MSAREATVKLSIPVMLIAGLMVVGCKTNNSSAPKSEAVPAPANEIVPPPAPAPAPAPEVYTPVAVAAPAPTEKVVAKTPAKAEAKAAPAKKEAPAKGYVVKKGDTLDKIAKAHKTTVAKLMKLNPEIKKADAIYVGQKLKMP